MIFKSDYAELKLNLKSTLSSYIHLHTNPFSCVHTNIDTISKFVELTKFVTRAFKFVTKNQKTIKTLVNKRNLLI
jgi:hypothetical protein